MFLENEHSFPQICGRLSPVDRELGELSINILFPKHVEVILSVHEQMIGEDRFYIQNQIIFRVLTHADIRDVAHLGETHYDLLTSW